MKTTAPAGSVSTRSSITSVGACVDVETVGALVVVAAAVIGWVFAVPLVWSGAGDLVSAYTLVPITASPPRTTSRRPFEPRCRFVFSSGEVAPAVPPTVSAAVSGRGALAAAAWSAGTVSSSQVEADARGFYHAAKKAFVSDGLPYNWSIQKRHFRDFTPILDFVHAVEHLYEAAGAAHDDGEQRWTEYLRWARACWGGNVLAVIRDLREHQRRLGLPPKDCEKTDPRKVVADAVTYFQNNASRMDYPAYRQNGLPTTSAHMESLVKEINARVKGTEKFWNDGVAGEAILQIRAAALCDDDRLGRFLKSRPGHPFHPNVPRRPSLAIAS